jgi:hypothetical protein
MIDTAYYDEDELMRQSALFAMGRSADRRWTKVVLSELGSRDPAMRFEAAVAAGELALASAVKALILLLDDADGNVREAAALALGKIGGRDARRALQSVLNSSDERLVEAAEEALEELVFNSETFDDRMMDFGEPVMSDHDELPEEDRDEVYDPDLYGGDFLDDEDWFDEDREADATGWYEDDEAI